MTYFELYLNYLKRYNKEDNPNKNNDFYNLLFHHSKKVKDLTSFFLHKNEQIDFNDKLDLFNSDLNLMGRYNFPVSFLTKKHYFYGHKYYLHKGVLIPRSETEYLVDKIIMDNYRNNLKILDLCSGIGVIGLTLAYSLSAKVTMIEKNPIPYFLSLRNKYFLKHPNHVKIWNTTIERYLKITSKTFDIIVMNPPYINKHKKLEKCVTNYEPRTALFAKNKGLYFYKILFSYLPKLVNERCQIYLEIDDDQEKILTRMLNSSYLTNIFNIQFEFSKDLHNFTRYLKIEVERK